MCWISISPRAVVLLRLATGVSCEDTASPPSSCSLRLEEERTSRERWYSLTDGQEGAALGHSDFRKAALGGGESDREMRTKTEKPLLIFRGSVFSGFCKSWWIKFNPIMINNESETPALDSGYAYIVTVVLRYWDSVKESKSTRSYFN